MSISRKINSIKIVTLGCPKNIVDSEKIAGFLEKHGYNVFFDDNQNEKYDLVLINTCAFINDAKEESIDTILHYIKEKEQGKIKKIIVFGCLAERYKNEIKKELYEVGEFYGVYEEKQIIKAISGQVYKNYLYNRLLSTASHFAYLKIADGCNRKCAFCAIPLFKGKYHSYKLNNLLSEAKKLADSGVKELIIVAQDITLYGKDLKKQTNIVDLVDKLSNIKGFEWIRLHYLYPSHDFPFELIDLMKERNNICKYIDIPFQHVSNNILSRMHRGHNKDDIINIINTTRSKIPDITIRTAFIIGFPGETKNDFNELLDFLKEYKLERVGVFKYSEEEGTYASTKYKDNISEKVILNRIDEIMKLQAKISFEKNREKIGKTLRVIVDYFDGEFYAGRTEGDSPEIDNEVLIKINNKSNKIKIGNFYNVKITNAEEYDLFGEVI